MARLTAAELALRARDRSALCPKIGVEETFLQLKQTGDWSSDVCSSDLYQ